MSEARGCRCQVCGRLYRIDLFVFSEQWDRIRPAGREGEGGLLCGSCIMARLEESESFGGYFLATTPTGDYAELVEELGWYASEWAEDKPLLAATCAKGAQAITALQQRLAEVERESADLKHDLDRYMKIANIECNEAERFREALNAIIDRGPERDIKWAGMNARDIARIALKGETPDAEG